MTTALASFNVSKRFVAVLAAVAECLRSDAPMQYRTVLRRCRARCVSLRHRQRTGLPISRSFQQVCVFLLLVRLSPVLTLG